MTKFDVALNRTAVNKSVASWDAYNDSFTVERLDVNELKAVIQAGHGFSSPHSGRRCAENWTSAQLLDLDFDEAGFDDVLEYDFIVEHGSFIYSTASHTEDDPRSRVVFLIDEPVTDPALYRRMREALIFAFVGRGADEACKDIARICFGSKDCKIRNVGNVLRLDDMADLLEMYDEYVDTTAAERAERRAQRAATAGDSVISTYNAEVDVVEIAHHFGYFWNRDQTRARRPDGRSFSVVLLDDNRTFHHSSSDPLFYGRAGGNQPADPFDFFLQYEHAGDMAKAVAAAAEKLGMQRPDMVAQIVEQLRQAAVVVEKPGDEPGRDRSRWTIAELLTWEFPDPAWTVPGLIPAGLVMLSGRPKQGKSFLGLQLANCVGHGLDFLGHAVTPAKVLYLALEDSGRRIQDRLRQMKYGPTGNVVVETEWPNMYDNGLGRLIEEVEQHGFRLVVVDTFSRIAGRADQLDLSTMGELFGALQAYAIRKDITLLVIDHQRKSNGHTADPVDDVMGSTGKTAPLDAVFGLYRKRGESEATLQWTGRDVEENSVKIRFDPDRLRWERVSDEFGVKAGTVKEEILLYMRMHFDGEATIADLARVMDKDRGNLTREMAELAVMHAVEKLPKRGKEVFWRLVDEHSRSM